MITILLKGGAALTKGLNAFQLKLIAIIAMLIDHIAWAFVPLDTALGQAIHFVGRITAPTMCFFIVQGYKHTRSLPRYSGRLALFAIVSQLPFSYYNFGRPGFFPLNVIYTLTLGLLAIHCWETITDDSRRWMAVILLTILSGPADWSMFGVAMCLLFHIFDRDRVRLNIVMGTMIIVLIAGQLAAEMSFGLDFRRALANSWYHGGLLLGFLLPRLYNGERGGGAWSKWLFYGFYPLHLVILGLLRWR